MAAKKGIEVQLSFQEMKTASDVGLMRALKAIHHNSTPSFPYKYAGELFGVHIIAAMAECVVAKHLNIYWEFHEGKFSCGDVGQYEVRYSPTPFMKVKKRDKGKVICVTGTEPLFTIVGWFDAQEARNNADWVKDFGNRGKPATFVPHESLKDI